MFRVVASMLAKSAKADFVKTSTGYGPGGATVYDVALMREAVGPKMGVKASGGVKTFEAAEDLIAAGAVGATLIAKRPAEMSGPAPEVVARLSALERERAELASEVERLQGAVADAERMALDNRREHQRLDDDAALARGRVTGANDPDRVRLHQCPHKQQLRVQRVLVLERHQGEEHSKRAEHACVSRL